MVISKRVSPASQQGLALAWLPRDIVPLVNLVRGQMRRSLRKQNGGLWDNGVLERGIASR